VTSFDFTADIVRVDGHEESKVGRGERPNPALVRVTNEMLTADNLNRETNRRG
jgi:hypothetical protein